MDFMKAVEAVAASFSCRGAVIAPSGEILCRVGRLEEYPAPGLVSALLGPYGNPEETFSSLDGQLLPQIVAQGDHIAVLDRPVPNRVVIFFTATPRECLVGTPAEQATALYMHSRAISEALGQALSS